MCADGMGLSVIVPTYGRAALLKRTLASYLQPEVSELIVVDDCSPDDTAAMVESLAAMDRRIHYMRSERNLKQTHAKNLGMAAAEGPLVYFGDDDSLMLPGSFRQLLQTRVDTGAEIVGASAPYMKSERDALDPGAFAARRACRDGALVDPVTMHCHFDVDTGEAVEAPFVHAAFLCTRELAMSIGFDEGYTGNCYREETDFLVRAGAAGARIVYEPRAVQANLPRSITGGGAQGTGAFISRKFRYFGSALRNNARFLRKNGVILNRILGLPLPGWVRQALFLVDILKVIASYPFRKLAGNER